TIVGRVGFILSKPALSTILERSGHHGQSTGCAFFWLRTYVDDDISRGSASFSIWAKRKAHWQARKFFQNNEVVFVRFSAYYGIYPLVVFSFYTPTIVQIRKKLQILVEIGALQSLLLI